MSLVWYEHSLTAKKKLFEVIVKFYFCEKRKRKMKNKRQILNNFLKASLPIYLLYHACWIMLRIWCISFCHLFNVWQIKYQLQIFNVYFFTILFEPCFISKSNNFTSVANLLILKIHLSFNFFFIETLK